MDIFEANLLEIYMKKIFISTLIAGIALSTSSLFAESLETSIPQVPSISTVVSVSEKAEISHTTSLSKMKARGEQLIKERVNALTSTGNTLANSKTLTADQKAAFSTNIATQISGLTTLGTSISASLDATSTKALVNKIFTDFRIYAIVIPQIRLEKRIEDLQNHTSKLTDVFVKIQTKIDAQKAKGKNVTVWQKSLDEAKIVIATDTTKLASLFVQISALKPIDYGTTSKATITAVNAGVKAIAKDFASIAHVARSPKGLNSEVKVNATTSATVSH